MENTYQTKFTEVITIKSPDEAAHVLTHFCNYCKKDAISRLHCSWYDVLICEKEKNKIINDFKNIKNHQ